jgi:putative spermidine/putrescine transport system substrate-binding protein
MRGSLLSALAILLIAAVAALYWFSRPLPVLTVATWGGPYGRAQASAQIRPYAAEKSVDVRLTPWDGELEDLAKAVANRAFKGDVIYLKLPRAVEACEKGLLEKIDTGALPSGIDGTRTSADFVPGALGPCWVGSMVYSQLMITSPKLKRQPASLADFFDTRKFPGRRALSRASPKFNLEMALLADGVVPVEIYEVLSTPEGLDRAFNKLRALRPIWAHDSVGALRWLANGQAIMATAMNDDVYESSRKEFAPGIIWDHQLYEFDVFAIPSGNPNKDRALDFIHYATGSAPLAGVASSVPYGPARRSALALVKDNPETKTPMRPWLPTAPENFRNAFAVDDAWWRTHEAGLTSRWREFVSR